MAKFSKVLLRSAAYKAPQGILRATTARLKHWSRQFDAMNAAGIRVPVSYGHISSALPLDTRTADDDARWRAEYRLKGLDKADPDDAIKAVRL